jgi:hypothetical protein
MRREQTEIAITGKFWSAGEIEIRAAHEIMTARTAQLAFLVDQLMPALQTKPPMLADDISASCDGAVFDLGLGFGF